MTNLTPMRSIPTVLLMVTLTLGCDSGVFQGEVAPCPCDEGGCSDAACPIEVTIDPGCAGQFDHAEVLVGAHIEASSVRPSERAVMCAQIEPGASAIVHVRGGEWSWGPLEQRCEVPRETQRVLLQCVEMP
jgi:hypothetical protein